MCPEDANHDRVCRMCVNHAYGCICEWNTENVPERCQSCIECVECASIIGMCLKGVDKLKFTEVFSGHLNLV